MMEFSQEIFDEFKSKYPDFPFMDKLEKDYKLSSLELLPYEKNEKWYLLFTLGVLPKIPFKLTQSIHVALQKSWNYDWKLLKLFKF